MGRLRTPESSSNEGSSTGQVVALKPYAIGTAARLAGIPPETVRIWERRYGLLAPGRTEGGHRLYSEDDVSLLRAVKVLLDAGMRIGTVARMPHDQILDEASRRATAPTTTVSEQSSPLIEEIIEASRSLDERRAATLLDRPLLLAPGDEVVRAVYLPLLARIGELWHAGMLPIASEHLIEKMVTARIHTVLQTTPQPTGGRLALCACPAGERHEVGLLAAALALKSSGFAVTMLGADLPAAELEAAVDKTAPSLVVLAIASAPAENDAALRAVLERAPLIDVPLLVGGLRAPALAARLSRRVHVVERVDDIVDVARAVAR
jgi:DNA-binding transcriptional MerR regulator/methylmalonyl-CoA mutase cobalamin-binding subunit